MLKITIPSTEYYNELTNEIIDIPGKSLELEHSLVSIAKWEAKHHKPFLSQELKTEEETLDYVRCMTITQNVDPNIYYAITPKITAQIDKYLEDPMTATWFREPENSKLNREVITNEIIYYWMIVLQIPEAYAKWHLNHLLTLVRVCNLKNEPEKKMGKKELTSRNRSLNAARKQKLNTRG